jgi:hypothetical protein
MSALFSKPKIPEPPRLPDPSIQERAEEERRRRLLARGRQSTILAGGLGVPGLGSLRKTLLGE